jgi:hypothetical protein
MCLSGVLMDRLSSFRLSESEVNFDELRNRLRATLSVR